MGLLSLPYEESRDMARRRGPDPERQPGDKTLSERIAAGVAKAHRSAQGLRSNGGSIGAAAPGGTLRPAADNLRSRATAATVLVVEDDVDMLNLALQNLTELGYRTVGATSADQAMAILL